MAKEVAPWNELVTQRWCDLTRKDPLTEDQQQILMKKCSPPEGVVFLRAPKLNPECKGLKNNSIVKKDEYNSQNQIRWALPSVPSEKLSQTSLNQQCNPR